MAIDNHVSSDLNSLAYAKRSQNQRSRRIDATDIEYKKALDSTRDHVSREHAEQLALTITQKSGEERLKRVIREYLTETNTRVADWSMEKLIDTLYKDMAGFGFLEEFLHDPNIEEVNAFAWNNIEVVTNKGAYRLKNKGFSDPRQAQDTVIKMVRAGGSIIDNTQPVVDSYLTAGIRVSAMIPPVTDRAKGVAFSIRKQTQANITKEDLLSTGTATEEMLDFLAMDVNYGASIVFAGKTGSGKTTDISYTLNQARQSLRIFTIEETRELYITRFDKEGRPIDNVIHTCTRPSDKERSDIDYDDLLRTSLRYHPDILALAEMRGAEALTVVESARTGHTVITSLHSNNAVSSYGRILSMCQMSGTTIPSMLLLQFAVEAFPIIAFTKQFPDKSRKITEIIEGIGIDNGIVNTRTLWKYDMDSGKHVRVNPISDQLATLLRENDAPPELVKRFLRAA